MITRKFIGSTISIIFGWIFLISASLQKAQGMKDVLSIETTGIMLILGGILHKVRKHQKLGASKLLIIIEIPILVLFLMTTLIGVLRDYWYSYPLSFFIIPLIIIILYITLYISK